MKKIAKDLCPPMLWRGLSGAKQILSERWRGVGQPIHSAGFSGEIGLLSIDIDGNDYWVWERIQAVSPVIVVVEYNSVFGGEYAVTVPYDPAFQRARAHHSHLYWGASLQALARLADRKGYALVGSNSAGNNAYFVRRDRLFGQHPLTPERAYVESRFRESRDRRGQLTFLSGSERLSQIGELPVYVLDRQANVPIGELYRR